MIELFIFLFILQGETPDDWLQSCNTDFIGIEEKISERNSDILFCKYVNELNLSVDDIEKLGKGFDWSNYAIETSKDFLNDWDFYQKNGNKETLVIWPSISTRDSLPPAMKVQISFDYKDGDIISKFDESFQISPLCDPPIVQGDVCNSNKILAIPSPNISLQYEISLKQQIEDGLSFNEILCPNNNHVLVERTSGKLACVYDDTAEKFNWIIQDEEIRENLWLINNPAVKDCVPKIKGDAWTTQPYENSTHSFDVEFCTWNLKTHDYEIEYEGGTYGNQYEIVGATVNEITYDPEANSLSISLNESKNGYIHIVIPLELFDGRHVDLESSDPFTLIDGEEVAYEQLSPNQLKINFEKGDKLIEIIGTYQI